MIKMIATHKGCGSEVCGHRALHEKNVFCSDGKCRFSDKCTCVPDVHESIKSIIYGASAIALTDEFLEKCADGIEELMGEMASERFEFYDSSK